MYLTKATINGLDETAVYPIVVMLAQDIRDMLGVSDTTPIRIGDNPPLRLSKNANSKNVHIPDIPDEELFIEYVETATNDFDIALTAMTPIVGHIYRDPDVRAIIKPIMNRRHMALTINYFAKSKSKVSSIINRLRLLNPQDKRQRPHDIEYHYYLPEVITLLVDAINTLKNTHTVPAVDLDEYIGNTFTTQANIVNSENGDTNKTNLAMRVKEQRVIGTIDTDVYTLEKTKDDDTNRWGFSIEYSAEYELPAQLLVSYPIAVYNQPIPKEFRISKTIPPATGTMTSDSSSINKLTERHSRLLAIPEGSYYLRIPYEDNLTLPKPNTGYVRLFSVVTIVDLNTPSLLFYLDELPGIKFAPDVLALIKLEAIKTGTAYSTMFHMELFNFNTPLYTHQINVSVVNETINGAVVERVKLVADKPLDIKGSYRVSFNLLTDLTVLPGDSLSGLKDNIAIVDSQSVGDFSVIDTTLGVLDLDTSKINPELNMNSNTTSMDIAMNISNNLWNRVFTKQTALILTEMLIPK